jgi:hypothetical protein
MQGAIELPDFKQTTQFCLRGRRDRLIEFEFID